MTGPGEPAPAPAGDAVLRIVAPNPGPMTLAGTNTYVVGSDPAWVVDPGPDDAGHIAAVRAVAEERGGIGGVVLTHSHADHTQGVERLGAPVAWGRVSAAAEWAPEGSLVRAAEPPETIGPFRVVPAPGHAVDHVALVLGEVCFCGDLVLGQGSSIVPPAAFGGSLGDYMSSLDRVDELGASLLCPGHGPWITDPAARIAEYREHRLERERRLVAALEAGERSRQALLDAAWDDVPEAMRPMAAVAMQAHLEKLEAEGRLPEGLRD